MDKKPVVYIEWADAAVVSDGWEQMDDVLQLHAPKSAGLLRAVGFLIDDLPEYVVIAGLLNPNNDDVASAWQIPRTQVRSMKQWDPDGTT